MIQRSDSDFQAQPSQAANEHERSCLCDASERKSRRCYELQTKSMIQQHFMLQCSQFWAFDEHLIHIKEFTHCLFWNKDLKANSKEWRVQMMKRVTLQGGQIVFEGSFCVASADHRGSWVIYVKVAEDS